MLAGRMELLLQDCATVSATYTISLCSKDLLASKDHPHSTIEDRMLATEYLTENAGNQRAAPSSKLKDRSQPAGCCTRSMNGREVLDERWHDQGLA